jgi:hypothetical protein
VEHERQKIRDDLIVVNGGLNFRTFIPNMGPQILHPDWTLALCDCVCCVLCVVCCVLCVVCCVLCVVCRGLFND